MKTKILITLPLADADRTYAREALAAAECRFAPSVHTPAEDLDWAHIILGNISPAERVLHHPNIRWLHSPNVGLDAYQGILEKRTGLRITNCRGISTDAVAEHALAMLMALSRALPLLARQQSERSWQREAYIAARGPVWRGSEVHILGYGEIARSFIHKFRALGSQFTVYRRQPEPGSEEDLRFLALSGLRSAIASADAVVNFLPGLPATRHIVDENVFSAMKPGAFFVNVGRGSTVDEAALTEALRTSKLGGAALDVFENEPLPAESPLWSFPNVIISPHVAGRFNHEWQQQIDGFAERLHADACGGSPASGPAAACP